MKEYSDGDKDNNPKINFLKHHHNCNVCDSMYITENYETFDRWDREYIKTFKKLKGANVTTCITKTFENKGHAVLLEELIEHSIERNMHVQCSPIYHIFQCVF